MFQFGSQIALLSLNLVQKFLNLAVEIIHGGILDVKIRGYSFSIDQSVELLIAFLLLFEELVGAIEITTLPFNLLDFSFAFGVLGLLLFEFIDIVLQLVLLEACSLNLVDLFFLLTDLILEAGHVLLFPLQTFLSLFLLLSDKGSLSLVDG